MNIMQWKGSRRVRCTRIPHYFLEFPPALNYSFYGL
uniref:Uncharacterized protein n=1 Tax=Rhizophora mucronata TaxID=61149 RepID=A0A2P2QTI2_RHIMU